MCAAARERLTRANSGVAVTLPPVRGSTDGSAAIATERLLVCRLSGRSYALPLSCVAETMRPLPIARVAGAPDLVLGLSLIRGVPVPVLDGARLVGEAPPEVAPSRFVLLKLAERRAAIAVDEVTGVRDLGRAELAALPPILDRQGAGALAALATLDGELLFVLRELRSVPDAVWATVEGMGA